MYILAFDWVWVRLPLIFLTLWLYLFECMSEQCGNVWQIQLNFMLAKWLIHMESEMVMFHSLLGVGRRFGANTQEKQKKQRTEVMS